VTAIYYPTDTLKKDVVRALTGLATTDFVPPFSLYFALLTALPMVDPSHINYDPTPSQVAALEVVATGYSRQAVTWGGVTQGTSGALAYQSNSTSLVFGPFTGTGGLAATGYGALMTAASGTTGKVHSLWDFSATLVSAPQGESLEIPPGTFILGDMAF
jgi:hypothetical protein